MPKRKYSILIPTRSRVDYLRHAILSALRAGERCVSDFEVIVADNASDDDTPRLAAEIQSPHVRWLRSEQRLSMRANFQRALDASTGTHICVIGDDDGMNLEGLAYLDRLLDDTDALVVQWPQVNYRWPHLEGGTVKVRFSDVTGLFSNVDVVQIIGNIRRADFFDYHVGGNIYHGCVARKIIEDVKSRDGAPFFHATSPDVYAAMQTLFFADGRMVRAQFPVSLGGTSPRSNGASSQRQSGSENSEEFRNFVAEAMTDVVGTNLPNDCRSISMITLDAFLHVCRRHGEDDTFEKTAWWTRIEAELASLNAEEREQHLVYARRLFGDGSLGSQRGQTPAVSEGVAFYGKPNRRHRQYRMKLTSVSVVGGELVRDLTAATEFIDRLAVDAAQVRPTRSRLVHGFRSMRAFVKSIALNV